MKNTFSKSYMEKNCGCYNNNGNLDKLFNCDFMKLAEMTKVSEISLNAILQSNIALKDKFWFVIKKCDLTANQKIEIAINCAEIVLPIFEQKYNENNDNFLYSKTLANKLVIFATMQIYFSNSTSCVCRR